MRPASRGANSTRLQLGPLGFSRVQLQVGEAVPIYRLLSKHIGPLPSPSSLNWVGTIHPVKESRSETVCFVIRQAAQVWGQPQIVDMGNDCRPVTAALGG